MNGKKAVLLYHASNGAGSCIYESPPRKKLSQKQKAKHERVRILRRRFYGLARFVVNL